MLLPLINKSIVRTVYHYLVQQATNNMLTIDDASFIKCWNAEEPVHDILDLNVTGLQDLGMVCEQYGYLLMWENGMLRIEDMNKPPQEYTAYDVMGNQLKYII